MPRYKAGVAGPIPLEDGRVVTDAAPFELEVTTPHDQELVDRGVILPAEGEELAAQQPKSQSTPQPVEGAVTTAGDGTPKEGE